LTARRLDGHRASDTRRFARIERQQQMTRAEIPGADHVHQQQSHHRRPAGIHAKQDVSISVLDRSRNEAEAAPAQPLTLPEHRQECRTRASRHADSNPGQDRANEVQPAIDVTADEELLGPAPLQFDALAWA